MGSIPSQELWVKGSSIATAVVQVAAVAGIQSLAQELPYIAGAALKKKTKKKNPASFISSCGFEKAVLRQVV